MALTLGRNELALEFNLDEAGRYGELSRLVSGLSQPPNGHSEMDYLVAALQASLASEPGEVLWSHLRGNRLEQAYCSADGVELKRRFDKRAPTRASIFRFSLKRKGGGGWWSAFRRARLARTETYQAVLQRCQFLPVDFKVDGRPIDRISPKARHIVLELAPRRTLEQGFYVRVPPKRGCRTIALDSRGKEQAVKSGELVRCRTVIQPTSPQEARLHWIKDGVLVSSESHTSNYTAWIGATLLRTDLSGFDIVRDKVHTQELKRVNEITSRVLNM